MIEKILKITIVLTLLAMVVLLGWMELRRFLDSYFRRGVVAAPALVGRNLTSVLQDSYGDLKIRVEREVYSTDHPAGIIVSQEPSAGLMVQTDATIFLRVSKGSDLRTVPDVRGLVLRRARLDIQREQLRIGHVAHVRHRETPRGTVLVQYPEPRTQAGRRSPVDLLLSDGWPERSVTMPRLVGLPRGRALEILREAGFARVNVIEQPTAHDSADRVIEHRPLGGVAVPPDEGIVLTVSAPPDSGEGMKTLEVSYQVPPGLSERLLEIVATDSEERRVIHRRRHAPGDTARVSVTGRGVITVQYYLDRVLVREEKF